jgi:uncharacterized protein (DUF1684 family)
MRWILLCLLACVPTFGDSYTEKIESWQKQRQANLSKPDGWLTLCGLYWLSPGENRIGSSLENQLVLPAGPSELGAFHWDTKSLTWRGREKVKIGQRLVDQCSVDLSEAEGKTVFQFERFSWYVIRRDGRWGLRVKDRESEVLRDFQGMRYYPIAPAWRVQGKFEPFERPKEVRGPSVISGLDEVDQSPGELVFQVGGKNYRLLALSADPKQGFSVLYGDQTNGQGSYAGGRFLWVDAADDQGRVWLDFNCSYTPPCHFTPYATCPRVRPENRLDLRVEAGEMAH